MKNSRIARARRQKAFEDVRDLSDAELKKRAEVLRGEREMIQQNMEELRRRVSDLSAQIAAVEAVEPMRRMQAKLGGIDVTRGSGNVREKIEPAVVKVKKGTIGASKKKR